jgi:hypothetical protein
MQFPPLDTLSLGSRPSPLLPEHIAFEVVDQIFESQLRPHSRFSEMWCAISPSPSNLTPILLLPPLQPPLQPP